MNYFKEPEIKNIVINALQEDIGSSDITTDLFVPRNKFVRAVLVAKEPCVISGLVIAALVFKARDKSIRFKPLVKDGDPVKKGKVIAAIYGRAKSILTAERVALNFISHLSGISTTTRSFVNAIKPYKVKIIDTRKTTPGLRLLEKYAVRMGGGFNHRHSLDEMVMVKDNHLKVLNGFKGLTGLAKVSEKYQVELEVNNLKEFRIALELKPDIIMLDNMSIKDIKRAVKFKNSKLKTKNSKLKLEASGCITLKNVKQTAACGVDMISVGCLTHSVNSIDISLETL